MNAKDLNTRELAGQISEFASRRPGNDIYCDILKEASQRLMFMAEAEPSMKPRPCRIPISAARRIALDYGYEQVVVLARKTGEGGLEHVTTFGINLLHCGVAAKMGDQLKKILGWPEMPKKAKKQ